MGKNKYTDPIAKRMEEIDEQELYREVEESEDACPLCSRNLVEGDSTNEHHLIPRTFKGKVKIRIHRICHNKIHSVFTDRELLNYYHTIDRLLENEEIQKFIKWVENKVPEFYSSNEDLKNKRKWKNK